MRLRLQPLSRQSGCFPPFGSHQSGGARAPPPPPPPNAPAAAALHLLHGSYAVCSETRSAFEPERSCVNPTSERVEILAEATPPQSGGQESRSIRKLTRRNERAPAALVQGRAGQEPLEQQSLYGLSLNRLGPPAPVNQPSSSANARGLDG